MALRTGIRSSQPSRPWRHLADMDPRDRGLRRVVAVQRVPQPVGTYQRALEERAGSGEPDQPRAHRCSLAEQPPYLRPVAGYRTEEQRGQPGGHPRLAVRVQGAQRACQPLVLFGQARQQQQVLLALRQQVPRPEQGERLGRQPPAGCGGSRASAQFLRKATASSALGSAVNRAASRSAMRRAQCPAREVSAALAVSSGAGAGDGTVDLGQPLDIAELHHRSQPANPARVDVQASPADVDVHPAIGISTSIQPRSAKRVPRRCTAAVPPSPRWRCRRGAGAAR